MAKFTYMLNIEPMDRDLAARFKDVLTTSIRAGVYGILRSSQITMYSNDNLYVVLLEGQKEVSEYVIEKLRIEGYSYIRGWRDGYYQKGVDIQNGK